MCSPCTLDLENYVMLVLPSFSLLIIISAPPSLNWDHWNSSLLNKSDQTIVDQSFVHLSSNVFIQKSWWPTVFFKFIWRRQRIRTKWHCWVARRETAPTRGDRAGKTKTLRRPEQPPQVRRGTMPQESSSKFSKRKEMRRKTGIFPLHILLSCHEIMQWGKMDF